MKLAACLTLLLAGCSIGRPTQERLGDQQWHAGRWMDAVASYRAAGNSPRLLAKTADAALQGGLLSEAATAFTQLGAQAPERAGEAAAGLARVAYAAQQSGKQAALALAVLGLRAVAPGWPVGRVAAQLGNLDRLAPADAVQLIPAVLASASERDAGQPLLLALGVAHRARGACNEAIPILEGVLRTNTDAVSRDSAAASLGWCDLHLGVAALDGGHPGDAERWFDRAARLAPMAAIGRRALVGFGDARLQQGDTIAATMSWQAVASQQVTPDSLTQMALVRLQQFLPPSRDSVTVNAGRP